ncbi:MBG domain-containing protein [Galbibacter sp. PAP.153]|uniref:beta strand repeat-containing protein n=1 Tax=Galbibacter sp. PAP.153 TaxID=3104623 RepID=UPI00300B7654
MDKLYPAQIKYLFLLFIFSTVTSGFSQSFTETYDDNPGFFISSNDFTNDDIRYQISGINPNYENATSNNTQALSEGGAGDYALQFDSGGLGGISEIIISLSSGGNFSLSSLSFDIIADANITFSSSSGGNVSFASNNISVHNQNYDFSSETGFDDITSFTISGGNIVVDLDDLSYTIGSPGNVDPVITGLPTDITVEEDATTDVFDISAATISDPDAGSGELTLTLEATGGIFDIATGTSITITGHLTSNLTLIGNLTNLNNYINIPTNIYFRPDANLNGNNAANVKVYISDNGNTGPGGGSKLLMGTVNVDITAVNDPPDLSLPVSVTVDEDVSAALTGITFSDFDAASGNATVQMSVGAGSLFAISGGGVTASGNGTTSISLTGTIANINTYIAGSNVEFQNQPGNLANQTLSVSINDNGNTGSGGNLSDTGTMAITITAGNTSPTAASFVAANGPYENLTYVFGTGDFGYSDSDGDALDHLIIKSLPTAGTLYMDADNDDTYDGGEELSTNDPVGKANLDAGNLQYIQNGSTNTSFQFDVSDGTDASTVNYTASLNVSSVPTVTLSVNPISKAENQTTATTITATLSNSYGANTTVNLSTTGGTATSSVDYSLSGTVINIPAGSTTGTVTLQNINDNLYESNETAILEISSVSNGIEEGTQQVTYTIVNDDTPPNASLEILDVYNPITNEAGGQAYVRGKIDNPAGVTVSIPLSFSGTATGGGTDYSITGSVITISPGEVRDSIRVTSLFDGLEEGDETVIIDMNAPTNAVENGTQQVTLTIKDANLSPPTGYSVAIDQVEITAINQTVASFTFAGAEVGATYNYTFSSDGGGTNVTGSGSIATATDQITGIDLSELGDGTVTLSVTLTDSFGGTGTAATDTAPKDTAAPTAFTVSIDQGFINSSNQSSASFTFSGAEVGTAYSYSFTSSGGGTLSSGSGTIATATDQITGIDLSGLSEGMITLSVTLTDGFGNESSPATDTVTKDTTPPSGYSVSMDLLGESLINSINESLIEFSGSGLEVGATLDYSFESDGGGSVVSGTQTTTSTNQQFDNGGAGFDLSGLSDGTVTLTIYLVDAAGNQGTSVTDTETKDAGAPSGYTVSWDDALVNASEAVSTSFTISNAEVGSMANYNISSSGDGNTAIITGNKSVNNSEETLTVDVSGLMDGTLTVTVFLTDNGGNIGASVNDNSAVLDQTAPNGYSVAIDQDPVDESNQGAASFTFAGAEAGATYNYTFSSDGGGTSVTGSGSIVTATDQITGIDLSGLADGTVSLSVTLTDGFGNIGAAATDTAPKDTNEAPSVSDLSISGVLTVGETLMASYTFIDNDGDTEIGSRYQWYRSDNASGTGKTAISSSDNRQYTLQAVDKGKYISFEVTPSDGKDDGPSVESSLEGPVKVDQNITFGAIASKIYGDSPFTLGELQTDEGLTVTYVADDPSVVSISGNEVTILQAGTTQITASQSGDGVTNPADQVSQTLTVNKAALTVAAEGKSKVYGEADPALTVSYSGFVSDDDEADLGGSLTVARATGEDTGTYAITASGKTSVNYTISYTTGELVITPATLTVSANAGQMKVYGTPDPELTYTINGLVNNDTENVLTGALSRAPGEGAGSYPIDLGDLSAGDNYDIAFETSEFVITKATQEIVWNQELNFSCGSSPEIALTATASSGLPVSYTVQDPSIAEIMAGVLNKKQSGSTLVMAHQPGDENHLPATSVEKRVLISQAGLIRRHWGDVLVFDNSSGDFVGYQWYKNGVAVPGATGQYYHEIGTLNGNYYVTATTEGGAVITSCSLELSGEDFTKKVSLVPNPVAANSTFVLESDFEGSLLNGATVGIIDISGRVLQTLPATGNRTRLGAPSQSGIYVVSLSLPNGERKTVNLLVK